jgi:hypothetical protein
MRCLGATRKIKRTEMRQDDRLKGLGDGVASPETARTEYREHEGRK